MANVSIERFVESKDRLYVGAIVTDGKSVYRVEHEGPSTYGGRGMVIRTLCKLTELLDETLDSRTFVHTVRVILDTNRTSY